jgi:hypothetical protein
LACALLGLPVHLDPRRNDERGLHPAEPRMRKTLWKRQKDGETVPELVDLNRRRRDRSATAPEMPYDGGFSPSPGLTVSNVVSRNLRGKKGEAAVGAMADFFTRIGIASHRVDGALHVEAGPGESLLCLPDRIVANRGVSPDVARIMVRCARALDWPAVVADGDQNSVDNLIVAGVPEELAIVNRPASSRTLAVIRHQFGALLLHRTEAYDRLGSAARSVRLHRAAQFLRAMAYAPRLAERAATLASQAKRQMPTQFQKALSYQPGPPKALYDAPSRQDSARPSPVATTASASIVSTGPPHASAGSHQANSRPKSQQSRAQFPAVDGRPPAIRENASSLTKMHARAGSTNGMRSALVQDQAGKNQSLETPGQVKLHPSLTRTQDLPDIELMPEDKIKLADVGASQINREFRACHELKQEQKRNAAQAIARKLKLAGQGPPKPKPG